MNRQQTSTPFPLGAKKVPAGWNFAVYSQSPVSELVIAPLNNPKEITAIPLDPEKNLTGSIWHVFVPSNETELLYGYRVHGDLLIDPYAKLIATGNKWGKNRFEKYKTEPLGIAFVNDTFDWQGDKPPNHPLNELIIYEMHVRGFNMTYKGAIEKIPYLKELGITAVELLPIFEFDEVDCLNVNPLTNKRLWNYWGYQPLSFFSPMQRYTTTDNALQGLNECKEMIKAFHAAGIEVILDIVFNHTGEGNERGHTISWKGFSENEYYIKDANNHYLNYSGCGNTLNCNHPIVSDMLIESLRYWVTNMHVDGFRFDLASILTRGQDGSVLESSPLLDRITQDGILSKTKLIAEPWDAAGLHQVGLFYQSSWKPSLWLEWNDDFRSVVRHFIKGDPGYAGRFATKLCGSQDIYGTYGTPLNSINFITCHDGSSLRDLVTYQQKYNLENGEGNNDGVCFFDSWNCGVEGASTDEDIERLRLRQIKNFCVALLISSGVPMIHMGDEYGHTKNGNNNTWCQDNERNWFLWDELQQSEPLVAFWKKMIQFRKDNPILRRNSFYTAKDIIWHSPTLAEPDWNSHFVACTLIDHEKGRDIYIAFNASSHEQLIVLPPVKNWKPIVNTGSNSLVMAPYSSLIFQAC
ncbi:MAG: glycogen-debranching protein [Verrucomicrobia bacterium]|nr:glycogen-debranching protein [Verrucomicrobiota bacterium]